jgi:hypothetical protein
MDVPYQAFSILTSLPCNAIQEPKGIQEQTLPVCHDRGLAGGQLFRVEAILSQALMKGTLD